MLKQLAIEGSEALKEIAQIKDIALKYVEKLK